ncbi:hypothetical protein SNEBB_010330 [Seison nebaliae]|nr:hypothetical protein SNEBB_010330 [Seison nebaliae]
MEERRYQMKLFLLLLLSIVVVPIANGNLADTRCRADSLSCTSTQMCHSATNRCVEISQVPLYESVIALFRAPVDLQSTKIQCVIGAIVGTLNDDEYEGIIDIEIRIDRISDSILRHCWNEEEKNVMEEDSNDRSMIEKEKKDEELFDSQLLQTISNEPYYRHKYERIVRKIVKLMKKLKSPDTKDDTGARDTEMETAPYRLSKQQVIAQRYSIFPENVIYMNLNEKNGMMNGTNVRKLLDGVLHRMNNPISPKDIVDDINVTPHKITVVIKEEEANNYGITVNEIASFIWNNRDELFPNHTLLDVGLGYDSINGKSVITSTNDVGRNKKAWPTTLTVNGRRNILTITIIIVATALILITIIILVTLCILPFNGKEHPFSPTSFNFYSVKHFLGSLRPNQQQTTSTTNDDVSNWDQSSNEQSNILQRFRRFFTKPNEFYSDLRASDSLDEVQANYTDLCREQRFLNCISDVQRSLSQEEIRQILEADDLESKIEYKDVSSLNEEEEKNREENIETLNDLLMNKNNCFDDLWNRLESLLSRTNLGISSRTGVHERSTIEGKKDENQRKNRYGHTFIPFDRNRVVLPIEENDYINASYVKLEDEEEEEKKYIIAQAPMHDTVTDFWEMIWNEKITQIVNLTKLNENQQPLCYRYWPCEDVEMFKHFEIKLLREIVFDQDNFSKRILRLKNILTGESRSIVQYNFAIWYQFSLGSIKRIVEERNDENRWDDGYRSVATKSLLQFRKLVKQKQTPSQYLLVHCNNGSSRCTAYLLIDRLIQSLKKKHTKSLEEIIEEQVNLLRNERMKSLFTKEQLEISLATVKQYYSKNY